MTRAADPAFKAGIASELVHARIMGVPWVDHYSVCGRDVVDRVTSVVVPYYQEQVTCPVCIRRLGQLHLQRDGACPLSVCGGQPHREQLTTNPNKVTCRACRNAWRKAPRYIQAWPSHYGGDNFRCLTCGAEGPYREEGCFYPDPASGGVLHACSDPGSPVEILSEDKGDDDEFC